jgi:hypothetical protein
MDAPDARPEFSRGATFEDLIELCRHLNEVWAKYAVIREFAVIHYGFFRGTNAMDLLIETSKENIEKYQKDIVDKAYLQELIERSMGPMPASPYLDVSGWHDTGDYLGYLPTSSNATARLLFSYCENRDQLHDEFNTLGQNGKSYDLLRQNTNAVSPLYMAGEIRSRRMLD